MANLKYELNQLCNRCREGSYSTQSSRRRNLVLIANQLRNLGFKNMQLSSLKQKHVNALIGHWQAESMSDKTMKNRLANLRWWAEKTNKTKIIKENNSDYGIKPVPQYTEYSKALHLSDADIQGVDNVYVQYSLLLQKYFGFRREAAIKYRPSYADKGDHLIIKGSWTKGGRPGTKVAITTEEQRKLLDEIKAFVGNGALIPPHKNYAQQLKEFEKQTAKAGIHQTHGLRHAYAQKRYKDITGWDCPHAGGAKRKELDETQQAIDTHARQIIAQELNHNRISITFTYIGK